MPYCENRMIAGHKNSKMLDRLIRAYRSKAALPTFLGWQAVKGLELLSGLCD